MSTSAPPPQSPPAGWYSDPEGPGLRWWDGYAWTAYVPDAQAASTEPFSPSSVLSGKVLLRLALVFCLAAIGASALIGGSIGLSFFWIFIGSGIICAVAALQQMRDSQSLLTAEARAARIIVLMIIGAGLVYGAIQLVDRVKQVDQRFVAIAAGVNSAAAQAEKVEFLEEESTAGGSPSENVLDYMTGGWMELLSFGLYEHEGIGDIRRETAQLTAATYHQMELAQQEARAEGKPIPWRYVSDIERDIQRLLGP